MLTKILKYDLKDVLRTLTPFYIALLLVAILNRSFDILSQNIPLFGYLNGTSQFFYIILIVITLVMTFVVLIKRFYKNLLSDEGYLTNTLPVKTSTHIISKTITTMIALWISLIVIGITLCISYPLADIKTFIDLLLIPMSEGFGMNKINLTIFFAIYMTIVFLANIFMIYLAISLGQLHSENRIIYSGISWFILYLISQALSLILTGIIFLFNPSLWSSMSNNTLPVSIMQTVMLCVTCLQMGIMIVYHFLTIHLLNKKLNLE